MDDSRKENQEEDAMVSSEGESTGVRRTRPTERAKEKENMKAKGELGGKGTARTRKSDDEGEERVKVDLEEGEADEEKKGTRRLNWADAEDNEEGKGGRRPGSARMSRGKA